VTATGALVPCPTCGADTGAARFCASCGTAVAPQAAGARGLLRDDAVEVVGLDRRLLRTLVDLLVHPVRITTSYMRGERGRYLPPLRLLLSLTSLYVVAIFIFQPTKFDLSAQLRAGTQDGPAISQFHKRLADRGVTPALAQERYESRMTAVMPLTSALSVLPMVVLLRLMHRRRPWHEHLMFVLGATNVFYLYGLLSLPLLAVGMNTFMAVLLVAMYAVFGVLYFKIYPARSVARTSAAYLLVALFNLVTGMAIVGGATVLVILSLAFI
jgi:hypothetical protein